MLHVNGWHDVVPSIRQAATNSSVTRRIQYLSWPPAFPCAMTRRPLTTKPANRARFATPLSHMPTSFPRCFESRAEGRRPATVLERPESAGVLEAPPVAGRFLSFGCRGPIARSIRRPCHSQSVRGTVGSQRAVRGHDAPTASSPPIRARPVPSRAAAAADRYAFRSPRPVEALSVLLLYSTGVRSLMFLAWSAR